MKSAWRVPRSSKPCEHLFHASRPLAASIAPEIESSIRKLTGKNEINQADIDERVAELEKLLKLNDEARSLDEAALRCQADLERIGHQLGEIETSINLLLAEAVASNEQEFI